MSKADDAQAGVRDAWDFWLSQHPITLQDITRDAVKEATTAWLDRNGGDLFKQAVTEWLDGHGDDLKGTP